MTWFTPAKRKAIYAATAALGGLLVLSGVLTQSDADHWLQVAGSVLDVAALVMAVIHTDTSTVDGMPAGK